MVGLSFKTHFHWENLEDGLSSIPWESVYEGSLVSLGLCDHSSMWARPECGSYSHGVGRPNAMGVIRSPGSSGQVVTLNCQGQGGHSCCDGQQVKRSNQNSLTHAVDHDAPKRKQKAHQILI